MKQISSLYASKFLAALAVVLMHAKVPFLSSATLPLCKMAVPFFFLVSGYCLIDDDGYLRRDSIRRSCIRLFRITVMANLIYLLFNVLLGAFSGDALMPILRLVDTHFWTDLVCFGGTVSGHLWYLVAYLQVLLFFWLLVQRRVPRWVYCCIPVGLVLNLILGNYGFVIGLHTDFQTSRNFFTIALPCVALGMWLHEHRATWEERFAAKDTWSQLGICALVLTLLYAESVLYKLFCAEHTADVWFMTVPASVAILLLCLLHPGWGSGRLSQWGRRWSLPIYIYHMMLIELFALLL